MKGGPLGFTVVPNEDGTFDNHIEVGTFPSGFIFPSVPGPLLRDEKELGPSREVVEV